MTFIYSFHKLKYFRSWLCLEKYYVKFYTQVKVAEVVSMCLWDKFVYCELYIISTLWLQWLCLLCEQGWQWGVDNCTPALKIYYKICLRFRDEVSKRLCGYLHILEYCWILHSIKYFILKQHKMHYALFIIWHMANCV